jgi:hypothetical protein
MLTRCASTVNHLTTVIGAALGFGDFAGEGFDLIDVIGMGESVMLTVDTDTGEVRFEVLAGEQNTEIIGGGRVSGS